jgi:hypothetical protein
MRAPLKEFVVGVTVPPMGKPMRISVSVLPVESAIWAILTHLTATPFVLIHAFKRLHDIS